MNNQTTKSALELTVDYLIQNQQKDGSFRTVCNRPGHTKIPLTVDLGIHSLTLDAMSRIQDRRVQPVIDRLASYLLRIITPHAATRFNDLDSYVLFYALSVLYEHDTACLPPDLIAIAIKHLVDTEQTPGGPYYNALDDRTTQPDWLSNVSISRFIHHLGGPFPKLTAYIEQVPAAHSRYYTAAWPLFFLNPSHRPRTANQHQVTTPKNIAAPQLPDRSWPVVYIHKNPHGKPGLLYGSAGLTAAAMIARAEHTQPKATNDTSPNYYTRLAEAVRTDTAMLDPLIGRTLQGRLEKLISADTAYEIGPFAARFADALCTLHQPDPRILRALGLANLYNWMAYTIYDDFLDDEGDPHLLSAANTALRRAVALFCEAVPSSAFARRVTQTFNIIDTANAWELKQCRFAVDGGTIHIKSLPDYGDLQNLHNRSLSHGLPVIGTLLAAGLPIDDPTVTTIYTSFKHYLIIRQLNDDLCDWRDDLQAGHISYVVARVLRDTKIPPGKRLLRSLQAKLEPVFWEQSLPHIDSLVQHHAAQATQLLIGSNILRPDNFVLQLIHNLADSSAQMRAKHRQTNDFLQAFQAQID